MNPTPTPPPDKSTTSTPTPTTTTSNLRYIRYNAAHEDAYVPAMRQLISKDLSEPYSIYVYRYFLYQWGDLCFMAMDDSLPSPMVGVVVSKLEPHRGGPLRGYIAMLAVREEYRGQGIATKLARMAIDAMVEREADEIVLETETTNTAAIKLYERLGFLRSKRLHRYYLNGNSAYRLVLYVKEGTGSMRTNLDAYAPQQQQQSGPPYPVVESRAEMSGAVTAPEPALLHEGNGRGW
ncbi:N-alpha-acetyltransferase 30, NatC catalytic subunit [Aspergillus sclerotiicarbonarius CBS 121057]|uniref:N-terminal methionine N(alpha)-acetyltransferase NatC n=1 Tax=Aspergillus sclerotiicarbonarius (strain CBS 121057 / IBT 28362) TaxID=1448318 RepID=A0A319EBJ2_ASPSB|nr:N-alpha-acetyltransferase 30, NatC catalytic subunit [Aspergillus sclerotiicarbonarius CBS 121057]